MGYLDLFYPPIPFFSPLSFCVINDSFEKKAEQLSFLKKLHMTESWKPDAWDSYFRI